MRKEKERIKVVITFPKLSERLEIDMVCFQKKQTNRFWMFQGPECISSSVKYCGIHVEIKGKYLFSFFAYAEHRTKSSLSFGNTRIDTKKSPKIVVQQKKLFLAAIRQGLPLPNSHPHLIFPTVPGIIFDRLLQLARSNIGHISALPGSFPF